MYDYGYGESGIDFLKQDWECDYIITNPPFHHNMAEAFARHAVKLARKKVAMLGRLSWLESKRRKTFFTDTGLSRLWVFSERLEMGTPEQWAKHGHGARMVAFGWYVWDKDCSGPPTLGWI